MAAERLPWISADPASIRLFELAQKVAVAPTILLISGESGTGKDYLARLVHELGPRRDAPFLKIDCASLPPQLPAVVVAQKFERVVDEIDAAVQ